MEYPYDIAGGNSHIVDHQGNVIAHTASGSNTLVAGIVDIEALRQFRVMNLNSNWIKDLRTEVFRRMYEQPIHPANLRDPEGHAEVDEIYRDNIRMLVRRGGFTPPATPGLITCRPATARRRSHGRRCASSGIGMIDGSAGRGRRISALIEPPHGAARPGRRWPR